MGALETCEEETKLLDQSFMEPDALVGSDIRVLPRPDSPRVARIWTEHVHRTIDSAMVEPTSFPILDELETIVQQSADVEDFRRATLRSGSKAFPHHFRHNPGTFAMACACAS